MIFWDELEDELKRRESLNLRRFLRPVPAGALDLASNDYLGLFAHPAVIEAACDAARQFGAGARASRLVSGEFALVRELEERLAAFKKCEAALVFPSGFAANLGVITALSGAWPNRALFSHKRNHASIRDACLLAAWDGRVRYFRDLERLRVQLQEEDEKQRKSLVNVPQLLPNRKIIVIDGVFSMDGDVCDLPSLLQIAHEFDAIILLDDAHGTGTLGATGRGTTEHFGIEDQRIVQIGTLSKALGSQGGFVTGPRALIDYLTNSARSFIYSTGLNPPAVGAVLQSLQIIEHEPQRLSKLRHNTQFLAAELQKLGFDARPQPSPILPVILGDAARALQLSEQLEGQGIWCRAIRPPTVPSGTARLRIGVNATWDKAALERIVAAFALCRAFCA